LNSAFEHFYKTNTIRDKDSAGFSAKTQMSVYLPLFFHYLNEYLISEEIEKDVLRSKYIALAERVKELLAIWHPGVDISTIAKSRLKLGRHLLKWTVDLLESEDSWVSWFTGITNQFLNQSIITNFYKYFFIYINKTLTILFHIHKKH
jgi:hypothetical protein